MLLEILIKNPKHIEEFLKFCGMTVLTGGWVLTNHHHRCHEQIAVITTDVIRHGVKAETKVSSPLRAIDGLLKSKTE